MVSNNNSNTSLQRIDDLLITLAYFSIPLQILVALAKHYPSLKGKLNARMGVLAVLFALFILLCGIGHLMRSLGLWNTMLFRIVNGATALVSITTAFYLVPSLSFLLDNYNKQVDLEAEARRKLCDFMNFLCHEIRNPLFAITSTISFLETCNHHHDNDAAELEAGLACIHQSSNLMVRLVNDVLDISKLEAGELNLDYHQTFDIKALLKGAVRSIQSQLAEASSSPVNMTLNIIENNDNDGDGSSSSLSFFPNLIRADSARLLQIAYNLLSNAAKFTEQGSIDVQCDVVSIQDALKEGYITKDQAELEEQLLQQKEEDSDKDHQSANTATNEEGPNTTGISCYYSKLFTNWSRSSRKGSVSSSSHKMRKGTTRRDATGSTTTTGTRTRSSTPDHHHHDDIEQGGGGGGQVKYDDDNDSSTRSHEDPNNNNINNNDNKWVVFRLRVQDTGPGMEPELLESITNPYANSKLSQYRAQGGTGLGLTILDRLTDLMGGSMKVESEVGVGSTFTVYVPILIVVVNDDEHQQQQHQESESNTTTNNNKKKRLHAFKNGTTGANGGSTTSLMDHLASDTANLMNVLPRRGSLVGIPESFMESLRSIVAAGEQAQQQQQSQNGNHNNSANNHTTTTLHGEEVVPKASELPFSRNHHHPLDVSLSSTAANSDSSLSIQSVKHHQQQQGGGGESNNNGPMSSSEVPRVSSDTTAVATVDTSIRSDTEAIPSNAASERDESSSSTTTTAIQNQKSLFDIPHQQQRTSTVNPDLPISSSLLSVVSAVTTSSSSSITPTTTTTTSQKLEKGGSSSQTSLFAAKATTATTTTTTTTIPPPPPSPRRGGSSSSITNNKTSKEVPRFDFGDEHVVVLVVDDNAMNRKIFGRMLKQLNIEPVYATQGQEAVDYMKNKSRNYDNDDDDGMSSSNKPRVGMILMDWSMPVMDGAEAIRRIRNDLGLTKVPIIAVTACATEARKEELLQAGADEFATKPLLRADLIEKCKRHLEPTIQNIIKKSASTNSIMTNNSINNDASNHQKQQQQQRPQQRHSVTTNAANGGEEVVVITDDDDDNGAQVDA